MSDNIYNPHGKEIRFIGHDYKDLFTIPDGGYITITLNDGEQLIRKCKYHGECHVDVGMNLYHIDEFAEKMKRAENTYEPCPEPESFRGYMITDRMTVGDMVFVMAHDPKGLDPWVTWQKNKAQSKYSESRYFSNRSDAFTDYFRRADAERTGIPYNPAPVAKKPQGVITINNIEAFVGKTVDCERRMFHHYPLTIKKINDEYFYVDRNDVMMPFNTEDTIKFERVADPPQKQPKARDDAR